MKGRIALLIPFGLVVIGSIFLLTGQSSNPDDSQVHRPQFHFSPPVNWINDPNGLVFLDGEFHLFYQYNPFGNQWGHMSWGHAVSQDLVRWRHLPVALAEENGIMIFSGSAVFDAKNTSGLGTRERPPLVAIYTGHTASRQNQHVASSTDRGRTWRKYPGNPVLDIGAKDFRDPKVFWHDSTRRWIMVVALPVERKIAFYGSPDLLHWQRLGDFGPAGAVAGIWECPDLFPLQVRGSTRTRWVLIVNLNPGAVAGGSGTQYFVGDFNGREFKSDSSAEAKWADYGKDFYAAVSWSNVPESDGRRLWIAWMSNWEYADKVPTSPWRGAMTLPRSLSLVESPAGPALVQQPVREVEKLRLHPPANAAGPATLDKANQRLRERANGDLLEIEAEFEPGTAQQFGLMLRAGEKQRTRVGYDAARGQVFVDRAMSGNVGFHPSFPGKHAAPLSPRNGRIKLHVFLDRSSVELFANDGERVITDLIFPEPAGKAVELFQEGGEAKLVELKIWQLRAAF